MKVTDIFSIANQYAQDGNGNMAVELWTQCTKKDEFFGPAYINLVNAHLQVKNWKAVREFSEKFMNCPVTPNTMDLIPSMKKYIEEANKQLNPQPVPTQTEVKK